MKRINFVFATPLQFDLDFHEQGITCIKRFIHGFYLFDEIAHKT